MEVLVISRRSLPAYRHSFLVNNRTWMTTRIRFYYQDLAVSNETLFDLHFKNVFRDRNDETGQLHLLKISANQRFHHDDITVGCKGRKDSNSFYAYAMAADASEVDYIGGTLFNDFFMECVENDWSAPTSGEKAVQFMNLGTLIGYHQWNEKGVGEPFVDLIFDYAYPSILRGVYEKKDPLLVKRLWDMFCVTDYNRLMLFMRVPDCEHLIFMLQVGNALKFDFWGFKHGGKGLTQHIFIHYIKEKRLDLISPMLEYGFTLGEMDLKNREKSFDHARNRVFRSFYDYYFAVNFLDISPMVMVWFLVSCFRICGSNLIELPGFIEVFQKVSRTLSLPTLPPRVVRNHLLKARDRYSALEMAAVYELCCGHPSDSSVVAQLTHLCRCLIRSRLAANYQLPTAITDSKLPTPIKNFLNLCC